MSLANLTAPFKDPVPPMLRNPPPLPEGSDKAADGADGAAPRSQNAPPKTAVLSQQGRQYQNQNSLRFYYPGTTPGQPFKEDSFRYCYTFFKRDLKGI